MKEVEIFVIAHKKIKEKINNICTPLQVGFQDDLGYLRDNTGDTIAQKNKNYCELTGMYWIWKNYDLPEYIGLCHYRRFFIVGNIIKRKIDKNIVQEYFKKYNIILPKKFRFNVTVWDNYFKIGQGKEKDLIKTKKIIQDKYPEYMKSFNKIVNKNEGHYCNMFIMKKEDFKQYCEWLFDILFELERNTDLTDYTPQQARIYGYISEILLNVWVEKNELKIKECDVLHTENRITNKIIRKIGKYIERDKSEKINN